MEWISIKDQKPTENHELYVISDGDNVGFGYWDVFGFVGGNASEFKVITHWMPLPSAPGDI